MQDPNYPGPGFRVMPRVGGRAVFAPLLPARETGPDTAGFTAKPSRRGDEPPTEGLAQGKTSRPQPLRGSGTEEEWGTTICESSGATRRLASHPMPGSISD